MKSILVIDDDEQICDLLKIHFSKAGYVVRTAPDGCFGLKSHRQEPADLIITDIIMPDMEGLELIAKMRQSAPRVKMIAISGGGRNAPENYLEVARHLGAHRTFAKPFSIDELQDAVRDLLAV